MSIRVTLIPGDGIGPEVVNAAVEVIEAAGCKLEWERAAAGASAMPTHGTPIPAETLESIRRNKLALKGPLATPIGEGYRSANVSLRKEFDLYANVRPARSFAGVETRYSGVDLVVIRANTQGLYSGVEHYIDDERTPAESILIITRQGTAPDIAGKGVSNPTAVMLAGVMLLEHIGERTAADRLVTAVREAISSKEAVTPDLGGSATTRMFTSAVLKRLK